MPDSFFVTSKNSKRKRTRNSSSVQKGNQKQTNGVGASSSKNASRPTSKRKKDEELNSDETDDDAGGISDLELRASDEDPGASGDEDENETPAAKRLRLAKIYLDSVKEGLAAEGDYDAAEIDREIIASRLKQDVLEHSGKIHRFIADKLNVPTNPKRLRIKSHRLAVTAAVCSFDCKFIYTASKDGCIRKWDVRTGKRLLVLPKLQLELNGGKGKGKGKIGADADVQGHSDEVLALALSFDGKFLASGGKDRRLIVWDAKEGKWLKTFVGHRDTISCLTFRQNTHQLYTGSYDRTIKLFDLSVMGYVETLFGHQDFVVDIDAVRSEIAVSAGARDKTVRYWKIMDETQLVFRGGGKSALREVLEGRIDGLDDDEKGEDGRGKGKKDERDSHIQKFIEGSLDCVTMVDDSTFVSGGDSGSICLWSTQKKKPQFTQALAHGLHQVHSETEGIVSTPRWITALACLRYSDIVASGSWEGLIRLWKIDTKARKLFLIGELLAPGVVNSLQAIPLSLQLSESLSWAPNKPDSASAGDEDNAEAASSKPITSKEDLSLPKSILVVAGMGRETRLGRWQSAKEGASNGVLAFKLDIRTTSSEPDA